MLAQPRFNELLEWIIAQFHSRQESIGSARNGGRQPFHAAGTKGKIKGFRIRIRIDLEVGFRLILGML